MKKKILLLLTVCLLFSSPVFALVYTVTTCASSGVGSLRQAILDANSNGGKDTINFDIPTSEATFESGVAFYRIKPLSALPTITEELVIDGTTQPTSEGYDNPYGPEIEIDGTSAGTAHGLTIGNNITNCVIKGLVINRFSSSYYGSGIKISGGDNNRVSGCYLGTNIRGNTAASNYYGVYLDSSAQNNIIGSLESGGRNIISGNNLSNGYGIYFSGAGTSNNRVIGNYIGLKASGAAGLGNYFGVYIASTSNNYIGSTESAGRNIISSNSTGVYLGSSSSNNYLLGNYIGTGVTGSYEASAGNSTGVICYSSTGNIIGSTESGGRNIISGNTPNYGVYLWTSSTSNQVLGNYIGTDASGTIKVPNSAGVGISSANNNKIGNGSDSGRNIISGNDADGIGIVSSNSAEVTGNYIGVDVSGRSPLGNGITYAGYAGVDLNQAKYCRIGGTLEGQANVIAANYNGVLLQAGSNTNEVKGNYIGTNPYGDTNLGNISKGVLFYKYSTDSLYNNIGPQNIIAYNAYGVYIDNALSYEVITQNSIYDNTNKGIVLGASANFGIQPPNILNAEKYAVGTQVFVNGLTLPLATVEVFLADPDPTGYGEGRTFEAYTESGANGIWSMLLPVASADAVTATVTKYTSPVGYTSEFSLNRTISESAAPTLDSLVLKDRTSGNTSYTDERTVEAEVIGASGDAWQIRFAEDSGFSVNDSGWIPYSASNEYMTSAGESTKTVYCKLMDGVSNESGTTSDSIMYDISPPSAPVLVTPSDEATLNYALPTFTWEAATDTVSGIASYEIRIDGVSATRDATTAYVPDMAVMNGYHTWEVKARDGAGNWGDYSTSFNFTMEAAIPESVITVESPNGGEHIAPNATYNITWYATNELGLKANPITIRYSTNEGTSWYLLASNEANDGVFSWNVPTIESSTCRVSVEAEDLYSTKKSDSSDANFIVSGRYVTRTSDSGGGSLRNAMNYANSHPGTRIEFYMPTSESTSEAGVEWYKIKPLSALPSITANGTIIDATTQPTSDAYNNPYGPEIEIDGSSAGSSADGLSIGNNVTDCTIEGLVINRFARNGIFVGSGTNNKCQILSNYIGTDVTGTIAAGNGGSTYAGIYLWGSGNRVGKGTALGRNIISGNYIGIYALSTNEVRGNLIGTNAVGTSALGNSSHGIVLFGSSNIIGSTESGGRNIISGNGGHGIMITGESNQILGNYLGTDVTGDIKLNTSSLDGIFISGQYISGIYYPGKYNKIGDGTADGRNIISGFNNGIHIYGASTNEVLGNYIGTDASGIHDLGNTYDGVYIEGYSYAYHGWDPESNPSYKISKPCYNNKIGDGTAAGVNVISANNYGIYIKGLNYVNGWGERATGEANYNKILRNYIGTQADGISALGNLFGIQIEGDANYNQVGPENVIAYNSYTGVTVYGAPHHDTITRNSIYNNNTGIDLSLGGNGYISSPSLQFADLSLTTNKTTLTGYGGTNAVIEIFKHSGPYGYYGTGQGKTFIGSTETDSNGYWFFISDETSGIFTVSKTSLPLPGNTSIFSITKEVNSVAPSVESIVLKDQTSNSSQYSNDLSIYIQAIGASSDSYQLIASENPAFPSSTWEGYSPTSYFTLSSGDGTKEVYFKVKDVASNESSTVEASIILDMTPPSSPALQTPASGSVISNSVLTLTWEAATDNLSDIASYEINLDGTLATRDATTSYLTPTLLNGIHTWEVKARDGAGNWGSYSAAWTFMVDTSEASAPILVYPANGSAINSSQPVMSWEAAVDPLSGIASYEIRIDDTIVTQDATVTYVPPLSLSESIHSWEVRAKNGAGLWGAFSSLFTFTVKTGTPEVASVLLKDKYSGNTIYTRNNLVSVEAIGVTGTPSQMLLSESPSFEGGVWIDYAMKSEYEISSSEGTKRVYYKLRDIASNESSPVSATIVLDTTEPSIPTLESPAQGEEITSLNPTFSWQPATDNLSGIASYEIKIDEVPTTTGTTPAYTPETALIVGGHSWEVRAKDRAQNWGGFSSTQTFSVVTTTVTSTSTTTTTTSGSTTTTTSGTTTTTILTARVTANNSKVLDKYNPNIIPAGSLLTASLLSNGEAIASTVSVDLVDGLIIRNIAKSVGAVEPSKPFTCTLPGIIAGTNYTLRFTFESRDGSPLIFDAPIKLQVAPITSFTIQTTPLRGATLNIDFVAKEDATYNVIVYYVPTGVTLPAEPCVATKGFNSYKWKGAGSADAGQYLIEFRNSETHEVVIWKYFFVARR